MRIQETVRKPMTEAKYLNVDNTDRYRPIIRLFYLKYEKLKYWLYQEEVYEELKEDAYFREYTPEQCQQDLAALTAWGNLVTIQDTRKVATIEEFKNKKFRYQLSEATVEIERMVIRVENLFIESSSLEPTLLERLRINLRKISEITEADQEHIYAWWNDLNNDFIRLKETMIQANDVLSGKVPILGGNAAIIGGGMVGIETAEYVLHHSRGAARAALIEMTDSIGQGMVPNNLVPTMARLRQENVQMITGARVKKIDAGTIIADTKKGEMKYPGFTHVICAVGSKAWNPLYEEIKDTYETYVIGDAKEVAQALEAVRGAYELGYRL